MPDLLRQLVGALVVARLALDHVGCAHPDLAEVEKAKELAEEAIRAAVRESLEPMDSAQVDEKNGPHEVRAVTV